MKLSAKLLLSVLLITAVIICQSNYKCFAITKAKILFTDSFGITLISLSDNKVVENKLVPESAGYTYSFPTKVFSCCVSRGKVYILTVNTSKQNSAYVYTAENGKLSAPIVLNKIKLNNSSKISVDKNGNCLITSSSSKIQVYGNSGAYIKTYDKKVDNILQMSGFAIACSKNSLYKVTASDFSLINGSVGASSFYKISDDYIGDYYGNIYKIKNGFKKVITTDVHGLYQAAETDSYIIVYSDKKFDIYDKDKYSYIFSVNYNKDLDAVSTYNNKAAVIQKDNGSYKCELLAQSFFKNSDTNSGADKTNSDTSVSNNTKTQNTPAGIKLSSFKHTDKFIYTNPGLTISAFKSRISYNGYNISFGNRKSGKIRTNMEVAFTKGKHLKSYKFIVKGDVTGEGNVNTKDENAMFDHLLGIKELKSVYKTAGDFNFNNKLTNTDLLSLSKMI